MDEQSLFPSPGDRVALLWSEDHSLCSTPKAALDHNGLDEVVFPEPACILKLFRSRTLSKGTLFPLLSVEEDSDE